MVRNTYSSCYCISLAFNGRFPHSMLYTLLVTVSYPKNDDSWQLSEPATFEYQRLCINFTPPLPSPTNVAHVMTTTLHAAMQVKDNAPSLSWDDVSGYSLVS